MIGGGDGGVVRELNKNPAVKKITMCEIDEVCPWISTSNIFKIVCVLFN